LDFLVQKCDIITHAEVVKYGNSAREFFKLAVPFYIVEYKQSSINSKTISSANLYGFFSFGAWKK